MLLLLLQVYPTAIRAFGMALCSAMSRIGGMTAPFIAQVHMHTPMHILHTTHVRTHTHNTHNCYTDSYIYMYVSTYVLSKKLLTLCIDYCSIQWEHYYWTMHGTGGDCNNSLSLVTCRNQGTSPEGEYSQHHMIN